MSTSRALFRKEKFDVSELGTKPVPTLGSGEVLVKEVAVGLNPVDWKIQTDTAGEVESVGEGMSQFQKGDKVFHQGVFTGSHYGTFQEYIPAPAEFVSKLPANITFEQAASLPVGVLPWEGGRGQSAGRPALIIGEATSVGQYVIRFARLSGFSPIIATASLRNSNLLRSIGATHVVDRNTPACLFASEIARISSEPILLVFDTVGTANTQQLGYDTLAEEGHIILVLESQIKETLGSAKKVVGVFASLQAPANRSVGRVLVQNLTALLEACEIVPNPVEIEPGGLNGIVSGLEKLKDNLVSAKKLIVRLGETA